MLVWWKHPIKGIPSSWACSNPTPLTTHINTPKGGCRDLRQPLPAYSSRCVRMSGKSQNCSVLREKQSIWKQSNSTRCNIGNLRNRCLEHRGKDLLRRACPLRWENESNSCHIHKDLQSSRSTRRRRTTIERANSNRILEVENSTFALLPFNIFHQMRGRRIPHKNNNAHFK